MNENAKIFLHALFMTAVIVIMAVMYLAVLHYSNIKDELVTGFQVKQWATVTEDCRESPHQVLMIFNGVKYKYGPVLGSRDEAEKVMIELAKEYGI